MVIRRAPSGTKTLYLERVGVWYDEKQAQIHLSIPGHESFHTTVSNSPSSKRYHANLFKKLRALLEEQSLWPDKG